MPIEITNDSLNEKSSGGIRIIITDANGDAVTPDADPTWTLTDTSGAIINSREDVTITAASTMTVPLTGDDLAIQGTAGDERRVLTIEGQYDDSTLGSNIPFKEQCTFPVRDLIAVS